MIRILAILLSLLAAVQSLAQSRIIRVDSAADLLITAATFKLTESLQSSSFADRLTVTVGDSTAKSFAPTLVLFGPGRSNLRIILADSSVSLSAKEMSVNSRSGIWFSTDANQRQMIYPRDDASLEWEIILDSIPTSNCCQFPIQLNDLIAYYQPPLTDKEIAESHERADSITGSYAVYHPALGKLCHIYRPRAFDRDGRSVWCDLTIDSFFSITVPIDFLATGAYPIRIDPTFGYTTVGASSLSILSSRCYANGAASYRHTAGAGERVDSFRVHWKTYSGDNDTLDIALYSWNSGPQSRLDTAVWTFTSSGTAIWVTSAQIAQSLASGTEYTIAFNAREGSPRISYDAGITGDHRYDNVNDLPAAWTEDGTGVYLLSAFAYYTVTSSSQPTLTRRRRTVLTSN
jgi:hypothetical protein